MASRAPARPGQGTRAGRFAAIGLLLLLLASSPGPAAAGGIIRNVTQAVSSAKQFLGLGPKQGATEVVTPSGVLQYGPIVSKSVRALQFVSGAPESNRTVTLGDSAGGNVSVTLAGPSALVLGFQGGGRNAATRGEGLARVQFLQGFLETAEAPASLVEAFASLADGGVLAEVSREVLGNATALHVTCAAAEAGAAPMAVLCGPWAAVTFPTAVVHVITYGYSWEGFNPQFAWAFGRLVDLAYLWPWPSPLNSSTLANATLLAAAVEEGVNRESLMNATSVPNPLGSLPPDATTGEALVALAPGELRPPPGDCPPILCKSRLPALASCRLFGSLEEGPGAGVWAQLEALPSVRLSVTATGADALVAWDNATSSAYLVWQGAREGEDWAETALFSLTDNFRGIAPVAQMFPEAEVHRGFWNQFVGVTLQPATPADSMHAVVANLSGGAPPQRVVAAGHSLGAALASLTGVWASAVWPNATVLVAGTGSPKVGNADWAALFRAVVGNEFRYINFLDEVPSLPPLDSYQHVPQGLWLYDEEVLATDRPELDLEETSWEWHDCRYYAAVLNATYVAVPSWVFNSSVADA